MAIYISNNLYLADVEAGNANRPLIGWHSIFLPASVTASSGINQSAVWSPDTYSYWESDIFDPTSVTHTLTITTAGSPVDYIGVVGHNIGTLGATYSVDGSNNGTTWVEVVADRIMATNDPFLDYFDTKTYAFYRLSISVPSGAPLTPVVISHVKIGQIFKLERPVWQGEIPGGMDTKIEKISSKSHSGKFLGSSVVSRGEAYSISQKNNSVAFIRSSGFRNFINHAHMLNKIANGPVETFFYAWRPTTHPSEIQYCGNVMEFSPPSNQQGTSTHGLMQWSMSGDAFK
jgi:hypothetical protein